MNRDEAKQVLFLYRPGTADAEDPQIAEAMQVARQDPELGRWFNHHAEFQQAMRGKLREIEVPAHLKAGLLVRHQTPQASPWWVRRALVPVAATAAIIVVAVILAPLWRQPGGNNLFARFQERMVSEVQRQYAMEWETSDMRQLRESISARGGQADYSVPKGLRQLKLTGGAVLTWRSHPVSMVCFDRGGGQMLFLFVMKREAVKDPPPAQQPQLAVVHDLMTASWTEGGNAYLLAGPEEKDLQTFAEKYLD